MEIKANRMTSNELRIGNYVVLFGKIAQIQRSDFSETEHGIAIDSGKPIPLTEEWLLRFGFKNDYKKENWIGYFPLMLKKCLQTHWTVRIICNNVKDNFSTTAEIKHVHQLQNLYFALTGEELTLKQ